MPDNPKVLSDSQITKRLLVRERKENNELMAMLDRAEADRQKLLEENRFLKEKLEKSVSSKVPGTFIDLRTVHTMCAGVGLASWFTGIGACTLLAWNRGCEELVGLYVLGLIASFVFILALVAVSVFLHKTVKKKDL